MSGRVHLELTGAAKAEVLAAIDRRVAAGIYRDGDEVIRAALHALAWAEAHPAGCAELRRFVAETLGARAEVDRG